MYTHCVVGPRAHAAGKIIMTLQCALFDRVLARCYRCTLRKRYRSAQSANRVLSDAHLGSTRSKGDATLRLAMSAGLIACLIITMLPTSFASAEAGPTSNERPPATPESSSAESAASVAVEDAKTTTEDEGLEQSVDRFFGKVVGAVATVILFDLAFWDNGSPEELNLPFLVIWLVIGATFFTLRMGFVNFRMFSHAIDVVRGKYDNPDDEGEVTHFQALSSALSATVGLGNIAGVAIAVGTGGPGATFWMIIAGLLGMASKFTECTLGQMYRQTRPDGRVMGGAMYYLSNGLKEQGLGRLGKVLAVMFAILCVCGSFGGGNAFQVNQSLGVVGESLPFFKDNRWAYGLLMTVLVGIVIIGGIQRIASTAEKIVPAMCGIYVAACLYIIIANASLVPDAFGAIIGQAFTPKAGFGGLLGVLVVGFKRAAFSNEAGIGSAAIAHSAAKTEYPVREGVVALLEPFIDTVVVCTMTALVIVITGAWDNPAYADLVASNKGATLTAAAMGEQISWFPQLLAFAAFLFAYSTMISWSYYGERCWSWLFGDGASLAYKVLFLVFTFLGSLVTATNILDLSDLMILGMALPNILGLYLLSGKVKKALDAYTAKLRKGEMRTY